VTVAATPSPAWGVGATVDRVCVRAVGPGDVAARVVAVAFPVVRARLVRFVAAIVAPSEVPAFVAPGAAGASGKQSRLRGR
jgi:hypothetical protein